MSTREALVVEVKMEKHPNADSLSIVPVGGYTCVVNTEMWKDTPLGVYIQPDEIVDVSRPEFSFLSQGRTHERVKAKKLRGIYSVGLLIPAPEGAVIGQNLYEELGLQHYEPELEIVASGGLCVKGPTNWSNISKYDIENGRNSKYHRMFVDGEPCYISEKIHGCNNSYTFDGEKMHVRSRGEWKAEGENVFWRAFKSDPHIEEFCRANPNYLVCGEAYGQVQKGFNYGCKPGEVKFACFDIQRPDRTYLGYDEFKETVKTFKIPSVPVVAEMNYDYDAILQLAEGQSLIGSHIREGVVVKPVVERNDYHHGRVFMKIVSNKYLEKG
jgi:RNA ligase (TIGR02306 family)